MKHDSAGPLRSFPPRRRIFSAISIFLSVGLALAAFGSPVTTAWTYQGQLRRSGAAYNGTCNFQFSLWDAATSGTEQATKSINSVNVVNGLFTVVLDFGTSPIGDMYFEGEARWLATSVQCSGDGGFTPLDPRQPITAAPYALSLRPGATVRDPTGLGAALNLFQSGADPSDSALHAQNVGLGYAIYAYAPSGIGVFGVTGSGTGVFGRGGGTGTAIYGENLDTGLAGRFVGPVDVSGVLTVTTNTTGVNSAIYATNNGGGYAGRFFGPVGVAGGIGVTTNSAGVNSAIYGENTGTGYAGRFIGPVHVQGTLSKSAGSFQIDHPLDPANKLLSHSFVESPDMKNIYDGNVTTDASGSATVTLPDYFDALNRDYRYQLTVLGQFAQAIVSREIAGNSFEIRTDKPGVKVSWQVTGIRQDAYARAHPIVVEEAKPTEQKGLYLYPAGFGAGEEKRLGHLNGPSSEPGARDASGARPSSQASK